MNLEDVIKKTEKYDVITFDVFDTLLIRDVMKPVDVFRFSYGEIGRYIRILAEMSARKSSETGEVTLSDINKKCPFSCKREVQFEKMICRANPLMKSLYDELKKQGKRMYAISDMYLSSKVISGLLRKAGYDIPVIVSCEQGCNKTTGKLFQQFLNKYSLKPSRVLHIGDNKASDYEGAKKAGIKCILYNKHQNKLFYTDYTRSNYELAAFVNHGLNEEKKSAEQIGYEIVGPIILSFCQWIHKKYKQDGFERLFFLARDMHFTYEVYKRIYKKDKVQYLYVSRKALRYARTSPHDFISYLKEEGCYGNVAFVDTGWVGTAQVEVEKYAKKIKQDTDLGGLYLGSRLAYRFRQRSERSHVFAYASIMEQLRCELMSPFLEVLIGSQERQVVSYDKGIPVFNSNTEYEKDNPIKVGAKHFIRDWIRYKNNKTILSRNIKKPFEKLFLSPKSEDVELLGSLQCDDRIISQIITYEGKDKYRNNLSLWLKDLSLSPWKGGFFYKSFKHYKSFLRAYLICNTARNIIIDVIYIKRDQLE